MSLISLYFILTIEGTAEGTFIVKDRSESPAAKVVCATLEVANKEWERRAAIILAKPKKK